MGVGCDDVRFPFSPVGVSRGKREMWWVGGLMMTRLTVKMDGYAARGSGRLLTMLFFFNA